MRIIVLLLVGIVLMTLQGCIRYTDSEYPQRSGMAPQTTDAPSGTNIAHQQLTQNSPIELQEEVWKHLISLETIVSGASRLSVPGARAIFLENMKYTLHDNERAHIHPSYDGSLHISGDPLLLEKVAQSGRGEYHPRNKQVIMLYGPRNEKELHTIKKIITQLYHSSLEK